MAVSRSPSKTAPGFWQALDERLGISALKYEVPEHAQGIAYSLGGVSLVGMAVLVLTGIWLAQFYDPMPEHVRSSMTYILTQAPAGFFARNLHYWAANVVLVTVLLHMLRVLYTGGFKRPREANWLVGVGLLGVTVGLIFTGTALKWDQEALEAVGHNVEAAELLGGLGTWFSPQFAERIPLLARVFTAHVSVLPVALGVLLVLHFLLIKLHGLAPNALARTDATTRKTSGEPTRANFLQHLGVVGAYGLVGLGALVFLSLALPAQLGPMPVAGIEVTKPWWPFLPFFAIENWLGLSGFLWAGVLVFLSLVVVPLLDRSPYLHPSRRRAFLIFFGLLALALMGLGIYAKFAPGAMHLG
ncbi:MAG: cytochrome b N-terminal domain-containing protein [Thermaceae bacterium]|nr:cytochrome b N-terminal domain-containing protein [Thermaceae bacterium]